MQRFPSFAPLIFPCLVLAVFVATAVGYSTLTSGKTEEFEAMENAWNNMVENPIDPNQATREVRFVQLAETQAVQWRIQPISAYKLLSQLQNILTLSEMSPDAFRLDFNNEWPELDRPAPVDEGTPPVLKEIPTALLQVKIAPPIRRNSQRIQERLLENPILSQHLEAVEIRTIYPMDDEPEGESKDYLVLYALTFRMGRLEP